MKARAQVEGKCFDPQTAGIYHWLQVCRHTHTNTHTSALRGRDTPTQAWRSNLRASSPPQPGRFPGVLVRHPDSGACGPPLVPLPALWLSGRLGRSQSRGQRTHPLLPPPGEREARLTHGIGQGHVAGPLLSQGLMHDESCPVAPVPEAASSAPSSGRPAEHPTPRLPLLVLGRTERDCLWLRAADQVPPPSSLPLFSLPPLLPPSAPGGSSIGGPCSGVRLRKTPLPPPRLPHPSYPPLSLPSQTGSRFSPWGQGCAEKGRKASAWGQPTFSVVWREGLG